MGCINENVADEIKSSGDIFWQSESLTKLVYAQIWEERHS